MPLTTRRRMPSTKQCLIALCLPFVVALGLCVLLALALWDLLDKE
jgi:hypothetical protein